MKSRNNTILYFIAVLFGLLVLPLFASAQTIGVVFETEPLFLEINLLPGDSTSRYVEVTDFTGVDNLVQTEAINEGVCGGPCLADKLYLEITDGGTTYFADTLKNFFDAGEVALGTLGANGTAHYDYSVSFLEDTGDAYQETSIGFDLLVGFVGGNGVIDNGTILSASASGGGGNGPPVIPEGLTISNVGAADVDASGTATITWHTNYSATSQVIYGLASGGPYSINLTLPNFGYPSATLDDLSKVLDHSITITGLIPGETYSYRTVSHASPPTVSYEYTFTVPDGSAVGGAGTIRQADKIIETNGVGGNTETQSEEAGESLNNGTTEGEEQFNGSAYIYINGNKEERDASGLILAQGDTGSTENKESNQANTAAVLGSEQGRSSAGLLLALLALIGIYILWRAGRRYSKAY